MITTKLQKTVFCDKNSLKITLLSWPYVMEKLIKMSGSTVVNLALKRRKKTPADIL